jgi:copper chaperone
MTTTILDVDGMTCEGCENNVQFALGGINGVTAVDADHEARTVTVDFDANAVDEPALGEAIEAMGYTLVRQ